MKNNLVPRYITNLVDLTNRKFGRLTVIRFDEETSKEKSGAYWVCKCSCGNLKSAYCSTLNKGRIKSCGCLKGQFIKTFNLGRKPKHALPEGVAALNNLFYTYKKGAKKRQLCFKLDSATFKNLIKKNCYFCNDEPNAFHKPTSCVSGIIFNGIDRLDNSKGYEIDNVVPCCKMCNSMKHSRNLSDFLNQVSKIYKHKLKNGE